MKDIISLLLNISKCFKEFAYDGFSMTKIPL